MQAFAIATTDDETAPVLPKEILTDDRGLMQDFQPISPKPSVCGSGKKHRVYYPQASSALPGVGSVNKRDARGDTPLHLACRESTDHTCWLLDMGADPRALNNRGETPLHRARTSAIVDVMLASGADINARDNDGFSPIHLAIIFRNMHVVEALISAGASISIRCSKGRSPLDYACMYQQEVVVKTIINTGRVDVTSADSSGVTALHLAEGKAVIDMLVDAGADVDARDKKGKTPLHFLASLLNVSICALLNRRADINAVDNRGQTPLHRLCKLKDDGELVRFLLGVGANMEACTNEGKTPLHLAAQGGRLNVTRALLSLGAHAGATTYHREITPLIFAAARGHGAVASLIIEHGVNVNIADAVGQSPLHYAVCNKSFVVVQVLLLAGANPMLRTERGRCSLDMAIAKNQEKVAMAMIKPEFDLSTTDNYGRTPLHHSISCGLGGVALALLRAGADANVRDNNDMSPLDLAAVRGNGSMVDMLLGCGVNASAVDQEGRTSLHYAAKKGHLEVARSLIRAGADPMHRDVTEMSALDTAVCCEQMDVVALMVESGADVRDVDASGFTALHMARSGRMIDFLVEAGAEVDAENFDGNTALMFQRVRLDLVKAFIRHGADLNVQNAFGESVLHIAMETNSDESLVQVVDVLLRAGADESLEDANGFKPEHYCASDVSLFRNETRRLLRNAPRDRAWRRRALLLMATSLHQHGVARGTSDDLNCLVLRLLRTREGLEGIFRKVVGYL